MRTFRAARALFLSSLAALALAAGGFGCKRQEVVPSTPSTPPAPQAAAPVPAPAPAPAAATGGNSGATIQLSPDIPHDVTVTGKDLPSVQRDFDAYSWNTFIALNWPPGPDGKGNPAKKPGQEGDNPTVWEGWAESSSIFLAKGAKPAAWGSPPVLPAECQGLFTPGMRLLSQVGKTPGLLEAFSQPFDTGPLVDQHGRFARFEILVNQPMFDDIVNNGLYSKAGQSTFKAQGKTVQFACGDKAQADAVGAIMVKAAWKVLDTTQGDDPARFHTSTALVYTPAISSTKSPATCRKETVGLVGLHISHKTNDASQWIWSTFEHVDNVPTEAEVKSGKLKARYNFYNPGCKDCPVNAPPPRPWDPNKGAAPVQIVRVDVLPPFATTSAATQDEAAHQQLAAINPKSVWLNYTLISTQWPTNTQFGKCQPIATDPDGTPAPTFLANSTLESYVQGNVPNVSSSCIRCHGNATDTAGADSDFTFLLERAR
jgi:hypothetical protein